MTCRLIGDYSDREFAILGDFRQFLDQIFRQFFFAKKAFTATSLVFRMYALEATSLSTTYENVDK